ncbi:MAG: PIN domain-containing protein [Rhodospirillales bacterium]|nr:PIN domain-containing protein [Rhodospirillales bacterium]MDK9720042.1 PIN domain-containing protein [Rhodospirillales bacterium]
MIVGLDTNILAYAEGVNDQSRQERSLALLQALPANGVLVPVQVLGELFRVLTSKMKRSSQQARDAIICWQDAFSTCATTATAFQSALDLALAHRLSIWDALILSIAAENGCRMLLSEDMQHGFTWQGTTVVDPFLEPSHPLLTQAIA